MPLSSLISFFSFLPSLINSSLTLKHCQNPSPEGSVYFNFRFYAAHRSLLRVGGGGSYGVGQRQRNTEIVLKAQVSVISHHRLS